MLVCLYKQTSEELWPLLNQTSDFEAEVHEQRGNSRNESCVSDHIRSYTMSRTLNYNVLLNTVAADITERSGGVGFAIPCTPPHSSGTKGKGTGESGSSSC